MKEAPKNIEVFGIGQVSADDLLVLPEFPKIDSKIEIVNRKKQVGGSVPTTLKILSGLDINTSFLGKIGDDLNSLFIKRNLVSSGIDVSNLVYVRQARVASSQIWIDIKNGTKTTAFDPGTVTHLKKRNINFDYLPQAKLLHIDGREYDILDKIIDRYKNEGTKISIDTGGFRELTPVFLQYADIIIMPVRFATKVIGEYSFIEMLSKAGMKFPNKTIIITDGARGSICLHEGNIYRQKAYKVDTVDTNGAGDFFSAGFLYGYLNGWKIEKALDFAAAISAMKCAKLGNEGLFSYREVEEFINLQAALSKK